MGESGRIKEENGRIKGVSAAILAGGQSSRMGRNKALLPWGDGTVIGHVATVLQGLFDDVFLVAADPSPYSFLTLRAVRDREEGLGPLGGLEAALREAIHPRVFVVACDMPFLETALLRHMTALPEAPVVAPILGGWPEPLHALYQRAILPTVEDLLSQGERRVQALFRAVEVRALDEAEVRRFADPAWAFLNLNRPEDYERALAHLRHGLQD